MIDAPSPRRRDLAPWYLAAAVFWFEALGLLAIGALVVMAPFACWGHPIDPFETETRCSTTQNPSSGQP